MNSKHKIGDADFQYKKSFWSKIEKGLIKYSCISSSFENSLDIRKDMDFPKKYKGFYRMRRNQIFCDSYFKIMYEHKSEKKLNFCNLINKIYKAENKKEISFTSKLMATINPDLPIWDSKVINYITTHFKFIPKKIKNIDDACYNYFELLEWYKNFMRSRNANRMLNEFNSKFPNANITELKKIDLMLWQAE